MSGTSGHLCAIFHGRFCRNDSKQIDCREREREREKQKYRSRASFQRNPNHLYAIVGTFLPQMSLGEWMPTHSHSLSGENGINFNSLPYLRCAYQRSREKFHIISFRVWRMMDALSQLSTIPTSFHINCGLFLIHWFFRINGSIKI